MPLPTSYLLNSNISSDFCLTAHHEYTYNQLTTLERLKTFKQEQRPDTHFKYLALWTYCCLINFHGGFTFSAEIAGYCLTHSVGLKIL